MGKKRANGEGTIFQRASDKMWIGRYYVGNELKTVSAKKQEDCLKKLREKQQQVASGLYVEPDKQTVESWMLTWFDTYVRPVRKGSTADTVYVHIKKHIIPALGSIKLQKLRSEQVQAFYNKEQKEGINGKALAPASIRRLSVTLHSAMKQAVANKLINANPCNKDAVKLPKMEQEEVEVLQDWEYDQLLKFIPESNEGRAIQLMLNTGLRVSEVCGLRWKDVSDDLLTVNQIAMWVHDYEGTEQNKNASITFTSPKTKKSHRDIPLTKSMQKLITAQHMYVNGLRAKAVKAHDDGKTDKEWQEHDLVFCTKYGAPMDKRNILRTYHRILKKAGLNQRGLHTLRHTFATRAVAKGMDIRTLSELLGHENVATTLNLYVHSSLEKKREALDKMDAAASV